MRRARTERPENFEVDLSHPLMRGAVLLGLGQSHHSPRYRDESAKGNHGVLTNMDPATDWLWEPKLGRRVLDFDGNEYIGGLTKVPVPVIWTHAAWVYIAGYPASTDAHFGICMTFADDPSSLTHDRGLGIETAAQGGRVAAYQYAGSEKFGYGPAVPLAAWNHLVASYDGTNLRAYCNGIAGSPSASGVGFAGYTTPELVLARVKYAGLSSRMSDCLCWPRALSAAEIMQLADPSNVMMSGAIREPRPRRNFIGQAGEAPPSVGVRYGGAFRWAGGGIGVRRGGALRGA